MGVWWLSDRVPDLGVCGGLVLECRTWGCVVA